MEPPRGADVENDFFARGVAFEEEEFFHDVLGGSVIDTAPEEDFPLFEKFFLDEHGARRGLFRGGWSLLVLVFVVVTHGRGNLALNFARGKREQAKGRGNHSPGPAC